MQIDISNTSQYLALAGKGNNLHRYLVSGKELKLMFAHFERIPYIGKIECFEIYTKNPDTGEGGWGIQYVEGVKEKIKEHYPHFDCFITKGYPTGDNDAVKFHACYGKDDYELADLTAALQQ